MHDVCLQKLNVVFAMDRAGLVGDDGPTHHGVFDIPYLRCLPNMVLMAPRDEAMLVHMLRTAIEYDGPIALRYPRGEGVGVELPEEGRAIAIGTGEILSEAETASGSSHAGRRVALIGYGSGVGKALSAAELLRGQEIAVTVADARFAKPIDAGLMAQLAAEHDLLVTVEEGALAGGFGSAVWETLNDAGVDAARSCGWGYPTATSRTASPRCCTRRSASPASASPSASPPRSPIAAPAQTHRGLNETTRRGERAVSGGGIQESHAALSIDNHDARQSPRVCDIDRTDHGDRQSQPRRFVQGFAAMAKRRLDTLLAERGLFPSRSRAAASVMAGEVFWNPRDRPSGAPSSPASWSTPRCRCASPSAPRSSRAAAPSSPTRSTRAAWRSRAGARWTWAPPRAASPTACCSAARAR